MTSVLIKDENVSGLLRSHAHGGDANSSMKPIRRRPQKFKSPVPQLNGETSPAARQR
jgi:hypothetical protein